MSVYLQQHLKYTQQRNVGISIIHVDISGTERSILYFI